MLIRARRLAATLLAGCLTLPAVVIADDASPSVWTIEGQRNRVHLMGSVHYLQPGDFALGKAGEAAWRDAEVLYLELDESALDPAIGMQATLARAIDPDGRSLEVLLGDEAARVKALAAQRRIDLRPLAGFEPWFVGITLVSLTLAEQGYSPEAGVERALIARANAERKPILGLETLEQQLDLFDRMPLTTQRQLVVDALEEADKGKELIAAMKQAWRRGDDATLARLLEQEFEGEDALYEALATQRNRAWVDQIAALLDDDRDYLIVVGALHLVGRDNVVQLLGQRGIRARRQ